MRNKKYNLKPGYKISIMSISYEDLLVVTKGLLSLDRMFCSPFKIKYTGS